MIEPILLTSLYIFGIHKVTDPSMIFGRIHFYFDVWKIPNWIRTPLINCPPCMASVHGLYMGYILGIELIMLPVFIFCVCGLNYIIILKR